MKKTRIIYLLSLVFLLSVSSCTSTKKKSKKNSSSSIEGTSKEVISSGSVSSNPTSNSSITSQTPASSSGSTSSSSSSLTPPPEDDYEVIETFTKRMPAEFEPCDQVIMCYPEMMDASTYKEIAKDNKILLLCNRSNTGSSRISQAQNWVSSNNMNASNFTYLDMDLDDDQNYWARDFSPFFVYNNLDLGIVDFTYNRDRYEQNAVPEKLANQFNMSYSKMNLVHTGGNLMQNGRGTAFSDDLVISENSNNESKVRSEMLTYTGTDNYVITIDPQGDYIAHIDCWAKIVAPDKIIVAKVPTSNSRYKYYEQVATTLANTKCAYGYNYRIYRIDEPGGSTVAPYTNSLIANKHVYMPLGSNSTYNQKALNVYKEALPGYDIVGIQGYSSNNQCAFLNTDALHCRTHEIPDQNMLFIDSRDVYNGLVNKQNHYLIKANVVSYAKEAISKVNIHYSINDGDYIEKEMSVYEQTTNYTFDFEGLKSGDDVKYYIDATDSKLNYNIDPTCGNLDPHHFIVA